MRKWQVLEFDGKPYYAFIPEGIHPLKEEAIPEFLGDINFALSEDDNEDTEDEEEGREQENQRGESTSETVNASLENSQSLDDQSTTPQNEDDDDYDDDDDDMLTMEDVAVDIKPVIVNGKVQGQVSSSIDTEGKALMGDLYQVKIEGGLVTLEKLQVESSSGRPEVPREVVITAGISKSKVDRADVDVKDDEDRDFLGFQMEEDNEGEEDVDEEIEAAEEGDEEDEKLEEEEGRLSDERTEEYSGIALKCKVCHETFRSSLAFRKHVAWTHKRKVCVQENGAYICSVCDFRTNKKAFFIKHLQRKHDTCTRQRPSSTNIFPCGACGFVCRSKHSLQSHFIRKHTDRYEHQCMFCSKKFKVKGDLTNHVRFHHKEKPISCDVCGKLCLNSGSLYVHQKWAHYKPEYECKICKRRMVTQENLDQHMIMQHEKREKIVCAECGKTFNKKDSFKRHMAVHTGSKPFNCLICSKPFARRSQLRQHLLIHTGKRPFVCDICGKAFTQKPGLI